MSPFFGTVLPILMVIGTAIGVIAYRPYSQYVMRTYEYDSDGLSLAIFIAIAALFLVSIAQHTPLYLMIGLSIMVGLFVYRCCWMGPLHALGLTACQLLGLLWVCLKWVLTWILSAFGVMNHVSTQHEQTLRQTETKRARARKKYEEEVSSIPVDDGYNSDQVAAELSEAEADYARKLRDIEGEN